MPTLTAIAASFFLGLAAGYLFARRRRGEAQLPSRTTQELGNTLTHVAYEFVALERALAAFHQQARQPWIRLESALIHARNLIDFFWAPIRKRRPHHNGVYAVHYVAAPTDWAGIRDRLSRWPNQRYDALSAQLAHISVLRTAGGAPDFAAEITRLSEDLNRVWADWRQQLQATPWATAVDAQVAHWRATL